MQAQIQSEIVQGSEIEESIRILKKGSTAIQNLQEIEEVTNLDPQHLKDFDFLFYKSKRCELR